ncbi:MAG: matrixin family metalloprotease [Gemmatimonadales bacterium]|nr:matrixin family metalloprotease [Gemmatimonadales bacterium]
MTTRLRSGLAAGVAALTAVACAEIASPSRGDVFEWRLVVGTDTLSFHWPASSLPVKIWVEDQFDMPSHIARGIAQWESAFLYNEYAAALVSDSTTADVLVRTITAPPKLAQTVARLPSMVRPECTGATDIDTVATRFQLQLPIRMFIWPRFDPVLNDLTECFQVVAAHELGHSLGLFVHSNTLNDLMYFDPTATRLSNRDINTAELNAHGPSTMTPIR